MNFRDVLAPLTRQRSYNNKIITNKIICFSDCKYIGCAYVANGSAGESAFNITFDWDEINGVPVALIIRMAILKLLESDQNNGKP